MNAQSNTAAASNTSRPSANFGRPLQGWRLKVYTIIFEADTKAGRQFDLALIGLVVLSLLLVMLESVVSVKALRQGWMNWAEYALTALFTIEYLLRLICVRQPLRYATSFFGIVDLLAVLPTYLAFFFPELFVLVDVRVLRLLRVFRILKLTSYVNAYTNLGRALRASASKILVFLSVVLMIVLIMGTVMYVVEGPANGYTSIPVSVYWAISTITTVGFGDITPKTDLGRAIASLMMLLGWGVLAVPTGIMTAEMAAQRIVDASAAPTTRTCHACLREGLQADSHYCRHCGAPLPDYRRD